MTNHPRRQRDRIERVSDAQVVELATVASLKRQAVGRLVLNEQRSAVLEIVKDARGAGRPPITTDVELAQYALRRAVDDVVSSAKGAEQMTS